MARQTGTVRVQGLLDDHSYYESVFGSIVRAKGGASKEKIKNDPAFARVREHNNEFGNCAKAGSVLRRALFNLLPKTKDHTLVGRINKLMNEIKNCDETSVRGSRTPGKGLQTKKGRALMEGFDFSPVRPVTDVLSKKVTVDEASGTIYIKELQSTSHINWPEGSTHLVLQGGRVRLRLDERESETRISLPMIFSKSEVVRDVELKIGAPSLAAGENVFLLKVGFLIEENGGLYELKGAEGLSLGVIGNS